MALCQYNTNNSADSLPVIGTSQTPLTAISMVRGLLLRLVPRLATKPILPLARLRPQAPPSFTPTTRPASRLFHHFPARLTDSNSNSGHQHNSNLPPNATLSQRLKHLIKSYGWYALGVYVVIGALDFGVAFAGVNLLGAEYVSQVATSVKETISKTIHSHPPEPGLDEMEGTRNPSAQPGQEGLYAMIVLAWTIHKTLFLPVRVGLTAGLTPKLVQWLGRRGWTGTAGTKRAAAEMRERIRERRNRQLD